jgi:hypothetical protein
MINMCEKLLWNLLTQTRPCVLSRNIPIPRQNLLSECAWCTYSIAELAGRVCAMYWFRHRISCRNVCDVLIHCIDKVHYAPGSH